MTRAPIPGIPGPVGCATARPEIDLERDDEAAEIYADPVDSGFLREVESSDYGSGHLSCASAIVQWLRRLVGAAAIFGAMFASGIFTTEYGAYQLGAYSRDQEFRADRNAAIYLWRAGFRPRAMQEVLE